MKKKLSIVMVLCWVCFILTPLIGFAETLSIQHIKDVEKILQNLTEEQRKTLNQLKTSPSSTNSSSINFNKVKLENEGIDYAVLSRPTLTNHTPFWSHMYPFVDMYYKFKVPMKKMDLIYKDSKTGKAIGFVATTSDPAELEPDVDMRIAYASSGWVNPFTNDPSNPIADYTVKLPEGEYALEMIAYDEEGKSHVASNLVIIDNTGPEVEMDIKPGVVEINDNMFTEEDGTEAVWLHGTVYDKTVDVLKDRGFNYDQSSNRVFYDFLLGNGIEGEFPVMENGDVKFGIERSDIEDKPLMMDLITSDMGTAMEKQSYIFLKEGTEYTSSSYDKTKVKLGDTITKTLSFNNVKQLVSGEFEIEYIKSILQFKDVKLNTSIEQHAKENNLKIKLEKSVVTEGDYSNTLKAGVSIDGNRFNGFDGDMPFLDVTFKVVDDKWYDYDGKFLINVVKGSYMKVGQTELVDTPFHSTASFKIDSKHSLVEAYIKPEAFFDGEIHTDKDFTKLGAKVYAISEKGKKYTGKIYENGLFNIFIPASEQVYTIVIEAPGHLKSMNKLTVGANVQGDYQGFFIVPPIIPSAAGDVTKDSLIDIHDIKSVVDAYGKKGESLSQDINQDGVVDETDVRLVEKNFLKKGPDTSDKQHPQETLKGKDLKYFLSLIGLQPNS
ncbi:hypothetical protein CUC43_32090 (plasmid) [Bacillus thuringiensis LM1212]|uniref:cohesin domain-containing protein n=1 Tax=Bacillus thuringiensis TaxID=1428 RepID=UPI000494E8EB|nr:cohesin domain-containing protein [Bacillus thuringiensis]AXY11281.1 hypothetical protein CUC43_32090 [Bacillus thuringiensis LM1212]QDF27184.1 hypothetical protein FJR70_30695 [Bacillus tropicus]